ncbi:MAG: hypothetical protein MUO41_11660, partial [Methyloceanibacter sp.]|nr:hypothetical protein [Methyloceanibacter sp.]
CLIASEPNQGTYRQRGVEQSRERPRDMRRREIHKSNSGKGNDKQEEGKIKPAKYHQDGDYSNTHGLNQGCGVETVAPNKLTPFRGKDRAGQDYQQQEGPLTGEDNAQRYSREYESRDGPHQELGFLGALAVLVRERFGPRHPADLAEVPPKRRLRR